MIRAYLSVCGIGMGHARRMGTLAKALKLRGFKVFFSSYSWGYEYLSKKFENVFRVPPLEIIFRDDGTFDFHNLMARKGVPALFRFAMQTTLEEKYLLSLRPNIVISDSRLSTAIASWVTGIPFMSVINQLRILIPRARPMSRLTRRIKGFTETSFSDILTFVWGRSERIIVPDFPPPYTISKENLQIPPQYKSKIALVGPLIPIDLDFPHLNYETCAKNGGEKPKVAVVLSGTRDEKLIAYKALLSPLAKLSKRYRVFFITGLNDLDFYEKDGLTVYGYIDNPYTHMCGADLIVSTGGQTALAEAMKLGKPMVLVPPKGHTEKIGNSLSIVRMGLGRMIYLHEAGKELEHVVTEVYRSDKMALRAREVAKRISAYKGVVTVAKMVEEVVSNGFQANIK